MQAGRHAEPGEVGRLLHSAAVRRRRIAISTGVVTPRLNAVIRGGAVCLRPRLEASASSAASQCTDRARGGARALAGSRTPIAYQYGLMPLGPDEVRGSPPWRHDRCLTGETRSAVLQDAEGRSTRWTAG
jgi:hypothetical protein